MLEFFGGRLLADPGVLEILFVDTVNPKFSSTTIIGAASLLHITCSTVTARWLRPDDFVAATLAAEWAYLTTLRRCIGNTFKTTLVTA